ncbi:hypothetical protein PQZ11_05630 [Luminiphilus sp.]|nr:hypothetical protein [Luminiphilus sp.]MDC6472527.1 hypothetical protein [Luminiphilus sp.]
MSSIITAISRAVVAKARFNLIGYVKDRPVMSPRPKGVMSKYFLLLTADLLGGVVNIVPVVAVAD